MTGIGIRGPLATLAAGLIVLGLGGAARAQQAELARYIPGDGLAAYVESTGLKPHEAAWKKTAAYKLLTETTAGAMLEETVRQLVGQTMGEGRGNRPAPEQVIAVLKSVANARFAFGLQLGQNPAKPRSAVLVVGDIGKGTLGRTVRDFLKNASRGSGKTQVVTRPDGRVVTVLQGEQTPWAWWFEKDDLIVVFSPVESSIDAVVATIEGKSPSATTSKLRAELAGGNNSYSAVGFGFFDAANLAESAPPQLGLSGLKRFDFRWGFEGESLVSQWRVVAPAPRKGLLGVLDQPTFTAETIPPLPAGLTSFSVVSFDLDGTLVKVLDVAKALAPNIQGQFEQFEAEAERSLGVKLRQDLLKQIGPKMAFFVAPDSMPVPLTPWGGMASWFTHPPKLTALFEIRDAGAFSKTLPAMMEVINRQLQARMGERPAVSFVPVKGMANAFALEIPGELLPLPAGVRPTIALGKNYLAFAISPEEARKTLALETSKAGRLNLASLSKGLQGAPKAMTYLSATDPRELIPTVIANIPFGIQAMALSAREQPGPNPFRNLRLRIEPEMIPSIDAMRSKLFPGATTVTVDDQGLTILSRESIPNWNLSSSTPMAVALMLPAVQSARTAARRAQSTNNLKQIMLAWHNFHSATNEFPPQAIKDGKGKALLSWRVAILPYLDQGNLYNEFHLDEPWNSEHNRKLIEKMPAVYKVPNPATEKPNQTYYQSFAGKRAIHEPGKAITLNDITDGTSNTVAVVEAAKPVIWTKPDDIPFDPEKDLPKLGGHFPGGYNAAFADGSVRFLLETLNKEVLRALITKDGGEVVNDF